MSSYLKDPHARLDYAIDWPAAFIGGGAIVDSDWSVAPDEAGGIVAAAAGLSGARTQATLEGGVAGHVYRIANRVTLSDGRIDERTLNIRVDAR